MRRSMIIEIKRKFAGSVIGFAWVFLGPLLLMGIYTIIYTVVFRMSPPGLAHYDYVILILSGLLSFLGFSDGLTSGTVSLSANRELLLNTMFPAELLPLRSVLVSTTTTIVGMVVVLIMDSFVRHPSGFMLLVPIVLILQVMFTSGLVWVLSLANLVVRDIQQLLSYVVTILLIGSPIAYTPEMLPSSIKFMVYLNPLSYFVLTLQSLLLRDSLPDWKILAMVFFLGICVFLVGYRIFHKAKLAIFDYA